MLVYTREKYLRKKIGLKESVCLIRTFLRAYGTFFLLQLHVPTKSSKRSTSVAIPARPKQPAPDESGIMKKELDKAYERIAALEGRNQELTLQTTGVRTM